MESIYIEMSKKLRVCVCVCISTGMYEDTWGQVGNRMYSASVNGDTPENPQYTGVPRGSEASSSGLRKDCLEFRVLGFWGLGD